MNHSAYCQEQLRQALEHKLSQTVASLTSEKECSEAAAREREKKLLTARDQLILQHDEALLRAENDKQQALLMGLDSVLFIHCNSEYIVCS